MVAPLIPVIAAAMRLSAFESGLAVVGAEALEAEGAEAGEKNIEVTVPVSSTAIRAIGFHAAGIITVDFVHGGSYDYPGTEELFMAFLAAPSKGRFFNDHIK
jgi:hypothetical protein